MIIASEFKLDTLRLVVTNIFLKSMKGTTFMSTQSEKSPQTQASACEVQEASRVQIRWKGLHACFSIRNETQSPSNSNLIQVAQFISH